MAALIDAGHSSDAIATRFGVSERHIDGAYAFGKLWRRAARCLPRRQDRPRGGHRLHARRRSRGAARGVAPGQGPFLHPALYRAASPDRDGRRAEFRSRSLHGARLRSRRRYGHARSVQRRRRGLHERRRARAPARGSRSSKRRPPNYVPNGRGPKRCSIPNTASWRSTRVSARNRRRFLPNWPRRSSASSAASANSTTRKCPRTIGRPSLPAEVEQLHERRAEIDDVIDGLAVYTEEDFATLAGCIVTIGDDGDFCCTRASSNVPRYPTALQPTIGNRLCACAPASGRAEKRSDARRNRLGLR